MIPKQTEFTRRIPLLSKEMHLDEGAVVAAARRIMENADIEQED
jgi:hypothetical protein